MAALTRVPGLEQEGQGLPQRHEVSCSQARHGAQRPRCLWTFVEGWTAASIMQQRKLSLEVVPELLECHSKWMTNPKWLPLPLPRQGG